MLDPTQYDLSSYKGNPCATVGDPDSRWDCVKFGYRKAKIIITNIEAIKSFVADYEAGRIPTGETPDPSNTRSGDNPF